MTGKVMVPIIRRVEGGYTATLMNKRYRIDEEDLQEFKRRVRTYSYIPYVCSEEEHRHLSEHPEEVEKVFEKIERETLKDWCDLVPQKLPKGTRLIMNTGNDDKLALETKC